MPHQRQLSEEVYESGDPTSAGTRQAATLPNRSQCTQSDAQRGTVARTVGEAATGRLREDTRYAIPATASPAATATAATRGRLCEAVAAGVAVFRTESCGGSGRVGGGSTGALGGSTSSGWAPGSSIAAGSDISASRARCRRTWRRGPRSLFGHLVSNRKSRNLTNPTRNLPAHAHHSDSRSEPDGVHPLTRVRWPCTSLSDLGAFCSTEERVPPCC